MKKKAVAIWCVCTSVCSVVVPLMRVVSSLGRNVHYPLGAHHHHPLNAQVMGGQYPQHMGASPIEPPMMHMMGGNAMGVGGGMGMMGCFGDVPTQQSPNYDSNCFGTSADSATRNPPGKFSTFLLLSLFILTLSFFLFLHLSLILKY